MIDHEVVLLAVGEVFDQVDPPPLHVEEAARAAFSTRTIDEELLPLLQGQQLTPVRAQPMLDDSQRWFSFADDQLEVEVGARRERHGWALIGQVSGPVQSIWVQTLTELEPVDVDDLGRFDATVSAGPVRLKLLSARGRRVRTDWVTL
jgi:hypothetical protein